MAELESEAKCVCRHSAPIQTARLSVVFTAGTRTRWAHHQCWRSPLIFTGYRAQRPGALPGRGFSTKWPGLSSRRKCISEMSNRCSERISAVGRGQGPYWLEGSRKNLIPCLCGWWFLLVMSASNVVALKGPWGTTGNFGCLFSSVLIPGKVAQPDRGVDGDRNPGETSRKSADRYASSGGRGRRIKKEKYVFFFFFWVLINQKKQRGNLNFKKWHKKKDMIGV